MLFPHKKVNFLIAFSGINFHLANVINYIVRIFHLSFLPSYLPVARVTHPAWQEHRLPKLGSQVADEAIVEEDGGHWSGGC